MKEDRAEILRRKIELYRGYLRQSNDADLTRMYLLELGDAEMELVELMSQRASKRTRLMRSIVG